MALVSSNNQTNMVLLLCFRHQFILQLLHNYWIRFDQSFVFMFISKGADVLVHTDVGDTLLHLAAKFGSLSVVKIALEKGIPINSLNTVAQTALHLASDNGHTDCVKWLLEQGVNPNLEDKMKRKALDVAYDHPDITKLLCDSMGIPVIQMEKNV
jgi:ankyrin repeat protein